MEYLLYILLLNMTIDCILIWSEYLLLISIHTIQHLEQRHRHLMELYDYSLTRYIMEHMSHLDYCYCWQLLPYSDSPLNKYYLEWLLYICNIHIFRLSSDCNTLMHLPIRLFPFTYSCTNLLNDPILDGIVPRTHHSY